MKRYILIFGVSLLLFGFVRDYNNQLSTKTKERKKEIDINYMWIQQLKNGTDVASRIKTKKGEK